MTLAASRGRGSAAGMAAAGGWLALDDSASAVPLMATTCRRPFATTGEARAGPATVWRARSTPVAASSTRTVASSDEATARGESPSLAKAAGVGKAKNLGTDWHPSISARASGCCQTRAPVFGSSATMVSRDSVSSALAVARGVEGVVEPGSEQQQVGGKREGRNGPLARHARSGHVRVGRRQIEGPAGRGDARGGIDGVDLVTVPATGHVDAPVGHHGSGQVHDAVGLVLPAQGAGGEVESVVVAPGGADDHQPSADHG